MKKAFVKNDVEYSIKQVFADFIQYRASYKDGTQAWATIPGREHTRKQVIEAIDSVNSKSDANWDAIDGRYDIDSVNSESGEDY